jgi:hypothetical protein
MNCQSLEHNSFRIILHIKLEFCSMTPEIMATKSVLPMSEIWMPLLISCIVMFSPKVLT